MTAADFWTPDPTLWAGRTVFILGGGPSLRGFDFERLRGRTVLAVNMAAYDVPWAAGWYFRDGAVLDACRGLVGFIFGGLIFTACRRAKDAFPGRVRLVRHAQRADFPPPGMEPIRGGRSAGHLAVSLALACGAARIVLLGFDMRAADGRTHYHDRYERADVASLYADEFIPGFSDWYAAAHNRGCEIVNATPGSALEEFPMVDLDGEIARCAPS